MMTNMYCVIVLIFLYGLRCFNCHKVCEGEEISSLKGSEFSEIKFTQLWGHSSCVQWKEQFHHQTEKCRYEDHPSIFSIHGIWPTEPGTSGPNCCQKVDFNENEIESIENQLNLFWYEIDPKRNPIDFWTHEWIKHGSCAKVLPAFATQLQYFTQGLHFRSTFDLYKVLKDGGISPQDLQGKGYEVTEIQSAFQRGFGVNPYIQCLHTRNGEVHLLAVEMCLDLNLTPIDCSMHESRHLEFNGVSPCPSSHPILYQDKTQITSSRPEL